MSRLVVNGAIANSLSEAMAVTTRVSASCAISPRLPMLQILRALFARARADWWLRRAFATFSSRTTARIWFLSDGFTFPSLSSLLFWRCCQSLSTCTTASSTASLKPTSASCLLLRWLLLRECVKQSETGWTPKVCGYVVLLHWRFAADSKCKSDGLWISHRIRFDRNPALRVFVVCIPCNGHRHFHL